MGMGNPLLDMEDYATKEVEKKEVEKVETAVNTTGNDTNENVEETTSTEEK